ncbi:MULTISPECIES: hypothetical protein [unclassified Ruminococcus]|uniref:hypothetical protein n=1 Tax=unclassified Ruminococcus TaxID=2608920 RepID=UPI00210B1418|nr:MULTISPECIES: hypothetical protein [unclassified Ruminococcus]MCQ4021738.1 hypothetical protein [Ruminococcus sp. zg-924]MCQ4114182.1 hypothetical protein [Ruminococcus sp. zg-921]
MRCKKINIRKKIKYLDHYLIPQKGNYFKSDSPMFSEIKHQVFNIRCFTDYELDEIKSPLADLVPLGVEAARLSILELIETTDISSADSEAAYLFDKNTKKRYFVANGGTAIEQFTYKSYKRNFKTFANSFYFITALAINSSYRISDFARYKGDKSKAIFLHSPLDWTVALYNSLCYHKKCFVRNYHRDFEGWDKFLLLCCCVSEILEKMIEEIETYEL